MVKTKCAVYYQKEVSNAIYILLEECRHKIVDEQNGPRGYQAHTHTYTDCGKRERERVRVPHTHTHMDEADRVDEEVRCSTHTHTQRERERECVFHTHTHIDEADCVDEEVRCSTNTHTHTERERRSGSRGRSNDAAKGEGKIAWTKRRCSKSEGKRKKK